jgi:hypothetical protein
MKRSMLRAVPLLSLVLAPLALFPAGASGEATYACCFKVVQTHLGSVHGTFKTSHWNEDLGSEYRWQLHWCNDYRQSLVNTQAYECRWYGCQKCDGCAFEAFGCDTCSLPVRPCGVGARWCAIHQACHERYN